MLPQITILPYALAGLIALNGLTVNPQNVKEGIEMISNNIVEIVGYHGTGKLFNEFDKSYIGTHQSFGDDGFFFITDFCEAEWYANENTNNDEDWTPAIVKAHITLDNPLIVDADTDINFSNPTNFFDHNSTKLYNKARKNGNDGIVVKGTMDYKGVDLIVVFEPDQINIMEVK